MKIFDYNKLTLRQGRFRLIEEYQLLDENEIVIGLIRERKGFMTVMRNIFPLAAGFEFDLISTDDKVIQKYKKKLV